MKSHRTRCITPLLLLAVPLSIHGSALAQDNTIETLRHDVQRGTVAARSIGGVIARATYPLQVESAAVVVTLPSGKAYPGYLISAYEPGSGLFWWTFQGSRLGEAKDRITEPPRDLTFFVSDREIIGVELGDAPPALGILRSTRRVKKPEEGRNDALARISRSAPAIERGTIEWLREVNLRRALPLDFYFNIFHSVPHLELKVVSLESRGNGWRVTLAGREGRRAEVLLDSLFVLQGAEELSAGSGP